MKVITIIFCILTIIMLSALVVSIIKNDDKSTSNREKRYILLYLISFIVLMISSIISTLGNNILSLILFIIFLSIIILATIQYYQCKKKNESKHQKPLVPKKLEKNLKVLKDSTDGYIYKVKAQLTCCDNNEFNIEEIIEDDLNIIHCICPKCKKEYEIFNSELDGYDLNRDNDIKIIKKKFKEHKCSKCNNESYNVEINYEYMDYIEEIKEIKKLGVNDTTNIFTSMKVNLTCPSCNNKEKEYFKYESK